MINFIARLEELRQQRRPVFVELQNVEQLEYDGLVVLLSVMVQFKSAKIRFNGDFPINAQARDILETSGFFKGLDIPLRESEGYRIGDGQGIVTHAHTSVESQLTARVIEHASKAIWGRPYRCQGAQRVFVELMQNTNNHASPEHRGGKHWWVSVCHRDDGKKVSIAFVDYGVGVFRSLRSKRQGEKFYGALEQMKANVGNLVDKMRYNDAELLRGILRGEMHRTVSGKPFRGKGLPGIRAALERNAIANLHIITNTVSGDVGADKYELLDQNFEGTFLYWELNNSIEHCDGYQN